MKTDAIVYVIDDDASVRNAVKMLLEATGFTVKIFASAEEFLKTDVANLAGCLVLDVRMEGLSGLDLQKELADARVSLPIIFITGHGDIPMSVKAMKAGAVEFLTKPFPEQDLLTAVAQALERDKAARAERSEIANLRALYEKLTPREREVMALVVKGLLNKQIALKLNAGEATVKIHRGHVMLKMHADSVADLVCMADKLTLTSTTKVV